MTVRLRLRIIPLVAFVVTLLMGSLVWAQSYSHARIVRLSFVEGTVAVQRPDVSEWASAPVNTPIQEGFKLSTAESSFAEVEFENTSTARMGERTLLEFIQLALSPSGDKVNHLMLSQGYATFDVIPEGSDSYEVQTPDATFIPYGKTMFRVDLDAGLTRVAVFKGAVDVSSPYGSGTLAKNSVLELRPGAEEPYQISQGITKDDWDEWVEQRESAEATLRNKNAPGFYSGGANALQYGWDDLWNYGGWSYFPGYGYGWVPEVSAGWVPYGYGRWCWYPNWGYTWISAEPWGWLPFHYGSWGFLPGAGWFWLPGNFGYWSPAQVVWYQGPGWVGWAPASSSIRGSGGGQSAACQNAQTCTTAVSLNTFQNGKPVTSGSVLAVDPSQGRIVPSPGIAPTRLAMLPGSPVGRGASASGIAFDPVSGRFVNSFSASAAPVTPGAVSGKSGESPEVKGSGNQQALVDGPTRAGAARPAPTKPPIVWAHTEEAQSDSLNKWGSSSHPSWGHSAPSSGHSNAGSAVHSTNHESAGGGRSSAGFSGGSASGSIGGGGHSSGGGGGSVGGGGHSSSGRR